MTPGQILGQAGRMTLRDWRAGELRLLAAALVIAVAAVTSVGFFVDRIRLGLERDATQLLGADVVVSSDTPLKNDLYDEAARRGLKTATTITFPSMAINAGNGDLNTLAALKAVSDGYPLRGRVRIQDSATTPDRVADGIPAPGTAWVDGQVASALRLAPGGTMKLGEATFTIVALIAIEPDRGAGFLNFAPRVIFNAKDLAGTQLIQPGSRVTYRFLAAGERPNVSALSNWVQARLERGQRFESLEGGRPEMQRTLERAQRFLALVALLAAMIAAVAVAAAARRFSLRHLDSCAMMRCLGLPQRDIFNLFALEFVYVGVAACVTGMLAGFAFHFVLLQVLGSLIQANLPLPSYVPAVQGLVCGLVLLFGFALPPLVQLRAVPPLRVLRKDIGLPTQGAIAGYLLGIVGFLLLLLWSANDLKVGALTAGGFAGGVVAFALVAWGVLKALSPLRAITGRLGISWRFAIAAVQRRPGATVIQLVALAVGLMALLLLTVTRTDLVHAWRRAAPADAPNRFVINIQPDQVAPVAQRLQDANIQDAPINPMIRGRLIARNGAPLAPDGFANERAQRLVEREFNLSYAKDAPTHNAITAGKWFAADADEMSMEEGIAKTLGVGLGDTLTFDIAGTPVTAKVTSLRKVNWDSLRANFFVLMPPKLLENQPVSFMTAFHLEPAQAVVTSDLLRDFPNLTIVDMSAIFRQVQAVLDQVIAAVEFLFVFTLVAGVLVLYAALAGSHDERVREAGLLRALGASREQLSRAQTAEMLCLGGLAGLLAAAGATAIGWALARFAFEFDYAVSPWVFLLGIVGGAACALAGGWFGLRNVLKTPPLTTLREA